MRPLRVLIADDELLARKRMARLAGAVEGVEVVGTCIDGAEVLARVAEEPLDVVLLDIQMPGLTGLDASQLLPADGPAIIFTTAFPEHAVKAFDIGAADYLLKPVDATRLQRALERVRSRLTLPDSAPPTGQLALPTRRGVRLVRHTVLLCALFDGTTVWVYLANETGVERVFVDLTLSELEVRLPAPPFLRTHRRALVNLDAVELLEPQDSGGYLACIRGGPKVAVSRAVSRDLRRRLDVR
jgi:two-component system, LytTR family, response regulator